MKLKTKGNIIYFRNKQIILNNVIGSAYKVMNKIIVRFEVTSAIIKIPKFHNIVCLDLSGSLVWEAELPSNDELFLYYDIYRYWPKIIAHSLCYDCEINIKTGKIIKKKWIK